MIKMPLTMNDFTILKTPVVQLERILSFLKNILTEKLNRRKNNLAKTSIYLLL